MFYQRNILYTFILYTSILFYEINIDSHTKKINEVTLILRKLYKTQTEIMTRDARSFTRDNHIKGCRLSVPRIHKLGWQETHTFQKKKHLKSSAAPIILIGELIATGFRRYRHIWRNYFKDSLNLGISGNCVENVLWRARDISLTYTAAIHWDHTLRPKWCGQKSARGYCCWSHENCCNLHEESSKNNYHHYWHDTKKQDTLFSASKNR